MEKIQKALERARQQRADGDTVPAGRPRSAVEGAKAVREGGLRRPAAPPPVNGRSSNGAGSEFAEAPAIVYGETRVVAPSDHHLEEQRVVAGRSQCELADTFRVLRTQVLKKLEEAKHTSLGVTSANRGEGKSLTAVNLAVSLAMHVARTVLLVDVDLRRPSVHRAFGLVPDNGLVEYLNGEAPLASCLINPGIERLVLLPVRTPLAASSELLASPRMIGLAEELRSRYPDRIVIYDLPPVLVSDDALAFLKHIESCLIVIEDDVTGKPDIQRSIELLKGCHIIGTVLNKSRNSIQAYY